MAALPLLFALVAAPVAPVAHAAAADSAPRETLALSQVLADVEAASPSLLGARASAAAATRRVDAAGAWDDPFVAAGPDEWPLDLTPPFLRVEVTQAIPWPGARAPIVDAARAEAGAMEAAGAVRSRSLRSAALVLFLRALHVESARAATAEHAALVDEVVASTRARYAAGAPVHHELLQAIAERATLERDALLETRELAAIVARLDELRGVSPHPRLVKLVDDEADRARPLPPTLEAALAEQPELAASAHDVDGADARARAAQASALPDLVVQGMWMQSFHAEHPTTAGAMVGVRVPLLYPLKQGPAADAAAHDASAARAAAEALRLRLAAAWEEAKLRLGAAHETERLYAEQIVPATNAALEGSRAAHGAGRAPLSDVLGQLRAATAVALEHHAARLDVRLAEARLRDLLSSDGAPSLAPSTPSLGASGMSAGAPAMAPPARTAPQSSPRSAPGGMAGMGGM